MSRVNGRVAGLRENAKILQGILEEIVLAARPGVSTKQLDRMADRLIRHFGGRAAFKGYRGKGNVAFPASICASIGNVVAHGIPSDDIILRPTDVLSIDIGLERNGLFADLATTVIVGGVPRAAEDMLVVHSARMALYAGISEAIAGNRVGDISYAIQMCANAEGLSVVGNFAGHGIGKRLHEEPSVRNYGYRHTGCVLRDGMVLCIEPMVANGNAPIVYSQVQADGWTAIVPAATVTAHFEAMILVHGDHPEILGIWSRGF